MPVVIASHDLRRHNAVAWAVFAGMRKLMKTSGVARFTFQDLKDKYQSMPVTDLVTSDMGAKIVSLLNSLPSFWGISALTSSSVLAYGDTYGNMKKQTVLNDLTLGTVNRAFLNICWFIGESALVSWPSKSPSTWKQLDPSGLLDPSFLLDKKSNDSSGKLMPEIPYQDQDSQDLSAFLALAHVPPSSPVPVKFIGSTPPGPVHDELLTHLKTYKNPGFSVTVPITETMASPLGPKTLNDQQLIPYPGPGPKPLSSSERSASHAVSETPAGLGQPARPTHKVTYLERSGPEPTPISSMDHPALFKLTK